MEEVIPEWWQVVREMAGFIISGYDESELTEGYVKKDLVSQGYKEKEILKAYEWLEKTALSGTLAESLAMLRPHHDNPRIPNPIEAVYISEKLWNRIQLCRYKGLINAETVEKVVEGIRVIDPRDWEDEDVVSLLAELLSSALPGTSEKEFVEILEGKMSGRYS